MSKSILLMGAGAFTAGAAVTYFSRRPPLNYDAIKVLGGGGLRGVGVPLLTFIAGIAIHELQKGYSSYNVKKEEEVDRTTKLLKQLAEKEQEEKTIAMTFGLSTALLILATSRQWTTRLGTPLEALVSFVVSSAMAMFCYNHINPISK